MLTCSSRQPSAYTFPLVTRRTPFPEIRYLPFSRSDLGSQNARLTLGLLDHQLNSFHSRGRESAFSLPHVSLNPVYVRIDSSAKIRVRFVRLWRIHQKSYVRQ